jgi:hypothetical protein
VYYCNARRTSLHKLDVSVTQPGLYVLSYLRLCGRWGRIAPVSSMIHWYIVAVSQLDLWKKLHKRLSSHVSNSNGHYIERCNFSAIEGLDCGVRLASREPPILAETRLNLLSSLVGATLFCSSPGYFVLSLTKT